MARSLRTRRPLDSVESNRAALEAMKPSAVGNDIFPSGANPSIPGGLLKNQRSSLRSKEAKISKSRNPARRAIGRVTNRMIVSTRGCLVESPHSEIPTNRNRMAVLGAMGI